MSTRTNLRPQPVITDGDMSDDINSEPTILQSLTRVSYQANWTGTTPIGTLSVEVSNDYALSPDGRSVLNAGNWTTVYVDYAGASVASVPVSGNAGTAFIDGVSAAYAIRLVYTSGSGVGTLDAFICGKVS